MRHHEPKEPLNARTRQYGLRHDRESFPIPGITGPDSRVKIGKDIILDPGDFPAWGYWRGTPERTDEPQPQGLELGAWAQVMPSRVFQGTVEPLATFTRADFELRAKLLIDDPATQILDANALAQLRGFAPQVRERIYPLGLEGDFFPRRLPNRMPGISVTSTYPDEQVNLFIPSPLTSLISDYRSDASDDYSSVVYDVVGKDLSTLYRARLSTAVRVTRPIPGTGSQSGGLAFVATASPRGPGYMTEWFNGSRRSQQVWTGPGSTINSPRGGLLDGFDPPAHTPVAGVGVYSLFSWEKGGPDHPGAGAADKHLHGIDEDGTAWTGGHNWVNTCFYMNVRYDAPLDFEPAEHPRCAEGQFPYQVHLRYDIFAKHVWQGRVLEGLWRWHVKIPIGPPWRPPRVPITCDSPPYTPVCDSPPYTTEPPPPHTPIVPPEDGPPGDGPPVVHIPIPRPILPFETPTSKGPFPGIPVAGSGQEPNDYPADGEGGGGGPGKEPPKYANRKEPQAGGIDPSGYQFGTIFGGGNIRGLEKRNSTPPAPRPTSPARERIEADKARREAAKRERKEEREARKRERAERDRQKKEDLRRARTVRDRASRERREAQEKRRQEEREKRRKKEEEDRKKREARPPVGAQNPRRRNPAARSLTDPERLALASSLALTGGYAGTTEPLGGGSIVAAAAVAVPFPDYASIIGNTTTQPEHVRVESGEHIQPAEVPNEVSTPSLYAMAVPTQTGTPSWNRFATDTGDGFHAAPLTAHLQALGTEKEAGGWNYSMRPSWAGGTGPIVSGMAVGGFALLPPDRQMDDRLDPFRDSALGPSFVIHPSGKFAISAWDPTRGRPVDGFVASKSGAITSFTSVGDLGVTDKDNAIFVDVAFGLPQYTQAERDSLDTAAIVRAGTKIWNTTDEQEQTWDGSSWVAAGGSGGTEAEADSTEDGNTALFTTDIADLTDAAGGVVQLEVVMVGTCLGEGDDGAPATEEAVGARMVGVFKVVAGVVTQVGATTYAEAEGDAGWAAWLADIENKFFFDISGTDVTANVEGIAQNTAGSDATYRWRARLLTPLAMTTT